MKAKVLSLIEISVIFILTSYLFRYIQSIPLTKEIPDSLDGYLFPGYAVLLIISSLIYFIRTQRKPKIPTSEKLRYQIEITAQGFFPIFILSVLLSWLDWTQWTGAILISIIEIGLFFWFAYLAREKQSSDKKMGVIGGLALIPIASQISNRLGSVIVAVIYFYLFVALSEEILFRGYIQSRLNSVFGRPRHIFGIRWGWGLIVSSVLFGLWHWGWNPEMFKWSHVLWTMLAGLIFGIVREKSESVIAPAILHGIMNYGPQAILFYLFWN
jgi:membrane protease YdiL (CAAX protease family)